MSRILVTGGSGFIGTNLVESLQKSGHQVLNIDIASPRNPNHATVWKKIDILDAEEYFAVVSGFDPEYVVHLAARTDLHEEKNIGGYAANIDGVRNTVRMINQLPGVKRTIYASSRMVCRIDYVPSDFFDYCPPNLYGESKMLGEKIVREEARHDYVIVRPTSIWGPYFQIPYRTFFDTVRNGLFFIPARHNPKKSFGFVLNTVYQLEKMLFAPSGTLEQHYYLTDYPPLELKDWANMVSEAFGKKSVPEIPMGLLKAVALAGDVLQKTIWQNPPLTSFRLNNLITNMVYDTSTLENLCGKLPYTLQQGVDITTQWMASSEQPGK